ncbi:MAG: hypothetical protein NWS22_09255 [Porticoccaceae bacterium]|jgi:hypothetical protein|uniref:Flagellar biosynthesis protein FlgN n=2 Tax=OM182 clade TaxID=745002 RepID=A0A0R2S960_9GAMM|nr:MAG: hypothetical protein ABR69_11520 [OM182 bacterium BACL3 MAG-120507-bin80]KRO79655.1 MAG: hypothetical protein ABR85_12865 [OM182 bacterium BACL3 MAG-120619-bin3]MDA9871424.1 hypothetical protein [Gammaproteobacteria bacterium]MDC0934182.1 hypothetical protein [Gammaproteobacteria bacterium]MDP4745011.1 hypothetical protein [Porticoccaceae bacterium]
MQKLDITKSQQEISELHRLLEKEFDALKDQKIDLFEKYQTEKNEILTSISESGLLEELQSLSNQSEDYDAHTRNLDILHKNISECSKLQSRNEVLIRHKLIAIRETIDSFTIPNNPLAETYDSLGTMKKSSVKRPRNF